jgi:hypothetical protein
MTDTWFNVRKTPCARRTTLLRFVLFVGFAFFGYRLVNADLWAFICDEPVFLRSSRALLRSHTFATYSPLVGTQGVHYGPTALWLSFAVHVLFGADVETHLLVMLTLVTASNAIVAFAIGRLFGDRYVIPATLGVLVASSPYHFFWSRMAWDPLVNVCTGFIIALLCTKRRLSVGRVLAIGALIGFGVSTHPAMVPLACVALFMVFYRSPAGRRLRQVSLASLVAFVINLPYIYYLWPTNPGVSSAKKVFSFQLLSVFFPEALRVSTVAGVAYFFDGDWVAFQQFSRFWTKSAETMTMVLPWLAVVFALGLLLTFRGCRPGAQRVLTLGAIVVWSAYVVFYAYLQLEPHPHYQFSIWWVMLVPVAGLLGWLKRYQRWFPVGVLAFWGMAMFQFAFLVHWMHFVRERGGTRGVHYDAPLSQQRQVVRQLCAHRQTVLYVANLTYVFSESLEYIASMEPQCDGKRLDVRASVGALGRVNGRQVLRYAGPNTAKLEVVTLP